MNIYFYLIWASLWRKPIRVIFTGLSLSIGFLLFSLLHPVVELFNGELKSTSSLRLWVSPRHSISEMLPERYAQKVAGLPGVQQVSFQTWFGGIYKDSATSSEFTRWAVSAKSFLAMHPELSLSAAQLKEFSQKSNAAIIGRTTADNLGLKLGDNLPITADIWHHSDGSLWQFELVGIYDAARPGTDTTRMFVNYEFFDAYRVIGKGLISQVLVTPDGSLELEHLKTLIDHSFENSSMETRTVTEQEYILAQVRQMGDIALILELVMLSVFLTLCLMTANTMSRVIRERQSELATLQVLGFPRHTIFSLVLFEALILTLTSTTVGVSTGYVLLGFSSKMLPQTTALSLTTTSLLIAFLLAIGLAVVTISLPLFRYSRTHLVQALET